MVKIVGPLTFDPTRIRERKAVSMKSYIFGKMEIIKYCYFLILVFFLKDTMIRTVQGGVVVKIRMHTAVLGLVIQEESQVISVNVEVDQEEDLMTEDGVTMMVWAVVVTELGLANLSKVVGVINQMKIIGQNHFHQVNA